LKVFVPSRSNWNLKVLIFEERGKPDTNSAPGPHWWEASTLTTAPSLLISLDIERLQRLPAQHCEKYGIDLYK